MLDSAMLYQHVILESQVPEATLINISKTTNSK